MTTAAEETATKASNALAREIDRERAHLERVNPEARVLRAECLLSEADPLGWLAAQPFSAKTYWADRDKSFVAAGAGAAQVVRSSAATDLERLFDHLRSFLSSRYRNLRWYGGLRFDNLRGSGRWDPLGAHYFALPRFETGWVGNRAYFAGTAVREEDQTWEEAVAALHADLEFVAAEDRAGFEPLPRLRERRDVPDWEAWQGVVETTLADLDTGPLEKLVLARESTFEFDGPLNPLALLARLAAQTTYSFHFHIQPHEGAAFVGASPERLYKRLNTYVQSEALAGTRPRGATPEEDAALGDELRRSDKEIREHRLVMDSIRAVFEGQCHAIHGGDGVELLILRNCQHLLSRIEGMLASPKCDPALVGALHPTPAVGGVPTEPAVRRLAELEPFDRGWYCGPVGWVGYDATEFAVAIRSGLVAANTLTAFAGAGIVAGSDAQREWDEVENKLGTFLRALDVG